MDIDNLEKLKKLSYLIKIKNTENGDGKLKRIISNTIINNDKNNLANCIFELIYSDPLYEEYAIKLINNDLIDLNKYIDEILNYTSWGFKYFMNNLDKLSNIKSLEYFTQYFINNEIDTKELLDNVILNKNVKIRDMIMMRIINNTSYLKKDDILRFINGSKETKSRIPYMFLKLALKKDIYKEISNEMLDNYDILFECENIEKLALYKLLKENLYNIEKIEKYENLYKFYETFESSDVDQIITTLINKNDTNFLEEIINNKKITFAGRGSTTTAYKIENQVIKFTRTKHDENIKIKNLYLFAPTITKEIKLENGDIMAIEIQDYLEKSHEGKEITKEDIINWNNELEKRGYVVTDPLCKNFQTDNFGFLKDYTKANLSNIDDKEIPEWFKKRPLVLYDIDLIYEKDDPNKKVFKYN